MPERLKSPLVAIFLFLANVYVCRELFSIEYLRHMGSIEAAYHGISRYAMAHWRDLSWFPLWYNGIPYQNTYPPLLHLSVAAVAWLRGITVAHSYHWTIAVMYCLGPVTLFALVRALTGSRWAGLAAGALYSALSPSAWLMTDVARDLGSVWRPRRLQALVFYGEGPHVSAMTLLPLAFLMVHLAVTKRKPVYISGAVVAMAAVALTNYLAAFALALGIAAYLLASWRGMVLVGAMGVAAYCLAMPWLPPSTIAVTQYNARIFVGDYHAVYDKLPLWAAVIALSLGVLKLATRRLSFGLQFALFFTFPIALITLADAWFHVAIVPQPERYHLEMEMGLLMLAAIAGHGMFGSWKSSAPHWVPIAAMAALTIVLIAPMKVYRRYARTFLMTTIDIKTTSEWKTADWLNKNWSGERVMLPGSSQFWLTAFSDTPQMDGGFDQGITDRTLPVASYGLTAVAGEHWGEWSVLWLKALGVQAVAVSGPGSTEVFKPFVDPKKFEGLLEVLWRDGGDVMYRVSNRPHLPLARIVPRTSLVTHTPINGADVDPLRAYVAALDDPAMPQASFQWTSAHSARVTADVARGQVLSWQEAWHAGWHARVSGKEIPIVKDAIGLMTVDPGAGHAEIELDFDGGVEGRLAHWLSMITALGLLAWPIIDVILKKSW